MVIICNHLKHGYKKTSLLKFLKPILYFSQLLLILLATTCCAVNTNETGSIAKELGSREQLIQQQLINEINANNNIISYSFCNGFLHLNFDNDSTVTLSEEITTIFQIDNDGYWTINGANSGIIAEIGENPNISQEKNCWSINGVNTGIPFQRLENSEISYIVINDFELVVYLSNGDVIRTILPSQSFVVEEVPFTRVTDRCAYQGLAVIRNTIVHFNSSSDDHSSYGFAMLFIKGTYTITGSVIHNLGHSASADYCQYSDALLVGNGSYLEQILPRIDIVQNASEISPGDTLSFGSPDIISIELFNHNKSIGGNGCIACFGDTEKIIYILTTGNSDSPSGRKIFKCLLGMGTNDLSDSSVGQNDATRFGTFIPGRENNEYNGTLKVLSTFISAVDTQVYQGVAYYKGYLYVACGYTQQLIHKIKLKTTGLYEIVKTVSPCSYAEDGSIKEIEPEGIAVLDQNTLLLGNALVGLYELEMF